MALGRERALSVNMSHNGGPVTQAECYTRYDVPGAAVR